MRHTLYTLLLAGCVCACSDTHPDESEPTTQQTGYLQCTVDNTCDGGLRCDTAEETGLCVAPPADCTGTPDCACAASLCADGLACEDRDGGLACIAPNQDTLACPSPTFDACGGDLEGTWTLLDFCTPDGALAGEPIVCEGPGEDEPTCQEAPNARVCTLQYSGTATFVGGTLEVSFGVALAGAYTLDDACLTALNDTPEAACDELDASRATCTYDTGLCTCVFQSDPETEPTHSEEFSIDGSDITVRGAKGSYCVRDDRLTIDFDRFGPEGWGAWLFTRSE